MLEGEGSARGGLASIGGDRDGMRRKSMEWELRRQATAEEERSSSLNAGVWAADNASERCHVTKTGLKWQNQKVRGAGAVVPSCNWHRANCAAAAERQQFQAPPVARHGGQKIHLMSRCTLDQK